MPNESNLVEAMFSTDLPGAVETRVPNDLQWMPPGRHTINASRGGKPTQITVNVNEAGAQRAAAQLANYLDAANRGEGDAPYGDFNHDDQEASFHAKSFHWAGDDAQRGGIRAEVAWTGAGERAVLGRNYRRFSPCFYVDDATGEVTGLPVNVGGLVNRAAFQRIAPIMSKQAEAQALTSKADLLTKAKAIARARNLSETDAAYFVAKSEPYLYDLYRWNVYKGGGRAPVRPEKEPLHLTAAYRNEFCIRSRHLADALGVSNAKAIDVLAREQPALYLRYRAQLGLGDSRRIAEEIAEVQARTTDSPFFALSKQIAAQRSIDLGDAFIIAAAQRTDLADHYQDRS